MHPVMAPHTASRFTRFGQCEFSYLDEDDDDLSSLHVRLVKSSLSDTWTPSHGRDYFPFSKTGADAATTILSDLSRLAPSVAKEFVPKYHAENSAPLRLLMNRDFQGEENGYIAISYCRTRINPERPGNVVTPSGALPFGWTKEIEQFPLPTSSESFHAILAERRAGEGIWFDQACVNQEDEAERVASLGCMDIIYKNARTVVIALDDVVATPGEEQAMRDYAEQCSFLELSNHRQPNVGLCPPFMHQQLILWSFLERMLDSAWFDQADCAHEMKSGRNHVFIVRCHSHDHDRPTVMRLTGGFFLHLLVLACEILTTQSAIYTRIRFLHDVLQQTSSSYGNTLLAVRRLTTAHGHQRSFISTAVDAFRLQASGNPSLPEYLRRLDANREKMAIALNASGLPLAMTLPGALSRPSIESECFRSILLVALAARDPVALCTTGTFLELHDGSMSWLARPTSLDTASSENSLPPFGKGSYDISQCSDGKAEYAQLGLVFLELPHRTQPNPHFPAQVSRARTLIDLCIRCQLQGSPLWDMWQTPGHPRALTMRNTFIQTLACVFECGSPWLLELLKQTQQHGAPVVDSGIMEMLLNPQLNFQHFVSFPQGQMACSSLLSLLSHIIVNGIPWASGVSESSFGPLIVTAPTSSSPQGHSGKAIIFAPFEHSRTLLIAVPEVVKESHYDSLARGWILTSKNPYTGSPKQTVSWTVQSKGVAFGDGSFNAALERCGEGNVRNHRVYGPALH